MKQYLTKGGKWCVWERDISVINTLGCVGLMFERDSIRLCWNKCGFISRIKLDKNEFKWHVALNTFILPRLMYLCIIFVCTCSVFLWLKKYWVCPSTSLINAECQFCFYHNNIMKTKTTNCHMIGCMKRGNSDNTSTFLKSHRNVQLGALGTATLKWWSAVVLVHA